MKHMAIMGLMLAFVLPTSPAEPEAPIAMREITDELTRTREAPARTIPFGAAPAESRKATEQERRERTDALPPKAHLAAELCREADAVMAMAVDVARMTANEEYLYHSRDGVIAKRRYYPAAPAEVALKLSRLARNLRKEASLWGSPCNP